jgi:hypothetical protein
MRGPREAVTADVAGHVEIRGLAAGNRLGLSGLVTDARRPQETTMARHPARCLLVLMAALSLPLTGCSDDSPHATHKSSTSPSPTEAAASDPPASEATHDGPFSLREYEGSIDPGRHRVPLISWERTYPVDALVQVPDGFITPGGWVIENGLNGTAYGDLMFFGDVDLIDTDPCGAGQKVKPGPTVRDLAEAVTGQAPDRAAAPKPIRVGGYRGLYVQVRVPRDLSRCESGKFTVFAVDQTEHFWYSAGPGSVLRFWIVDVDGQRVAAAVKVVPGHTLHAGELVHMAKTAEFVENVAG